MGGLVLVGCALVFSPESVLAQTNDYPGCEEGTSAYQVSGPTFAGQSACASGANSLAIGTITTAAHHNALALGVFAKTTADHQMVFGSAEHFIFTQNSGGGQQTYAALNSWRNSYVFAGLAIRESEIPAGTPGFVRLVAGDTNRNKLASAGARDAHLEAVRNFRLAQPNRVLQVDGLGGLVAVSADDISIGSADQDASGSGTIYQRLHSLRSQMGSGSSYDDAEVRGLIGSNRDSIGVLDTRLTQGLEKNAQGVALSNALSAIPNHLSPGKKLRLGLGVGSFDGKSATAIGITGKFGASTLLNAGFSSGGGETSTRAGISWEW